MKKLIYVILIFSLTVYSQEYGNKIDAIKLCSTIQDNSFSYDVDANNILEKQGKLILLSGKNSHFYFF